MIRDNDAKPQSTALAATCAAELPKTVAACHPCLAVTGASALNPLPSSDTQRRERPGPAGELVSAARQALEPRAARRRFTAPRDSGSAAVTRQGAALAARPQALTAAAAHNLTGSAELGAARPADLHAAVAISAPQTAGASRTTAMASSLAGTTQLRLTKHLRANRSGPEDQLACTATGPTNSDHSSYSRGVN